MRSEGVTLRAADADALPYVERLLERHGLPTADIRDAGDFYIAISDDQRVGIGGLEQYGTDALLRSLVVEQSVRGSGIGSAVCAALEDTARHEGVETCYILTTTAADFFAARGYEEIERARVPTAIAETTEFSDLCPSAAVCMTKDL